MSRRERESSRSGWRMLMDEAEESERPSMPIRRRRPVALEAPLTQQQGRGAAKHVCSTEKRCAATTNWLVGMVAGNNVTLEEVACEVVNANGQGRKVREAIDAHKAEAPCGLGGAVDTATGAGCGEAGLRHGEEVCSNDKLVGGYGGVERLSIGDIQRLEWKALEAKIRREIHVACGVFANERYHQPPPFFGSLRPSSATLDAWIEVGREGIEVKEE
uniref:Uncharacterized protein n=1 Tax=Oryza meridionalis TaxID=40149 RepID=A0A0E0CYD8_9ORYZ